MSSEPAFKGGHRAFGIWTIVKHLSLMLRQETAIFTEALYPLETRTGRINMASVFGWFYCHVSVHFQAAYGVWGLGLIDPICVV